MANLQQMVIIDTSYPHDMEVIIFVLKLYHVVLMCFVIQSSSNGLFRIVLAIICMDMDYLKGIQNT
jgi:hypothetical protein